MLCLVLVLCAILLTACQQKEVFDTLTPAPQVQGAAEIQNLYGDQYDGPADFDDGTYDPLSEEAGEWEEVIDLTGNNGVTPMPTMQSEYAGATPVLIDPIDKPTPTPLPQLNFSYTTYEASAMHLTFEGPANWLTEEPESGIFRLTNPDPSMDYAATMEIRAVPVNKQYSKNELSKEVRGMLDTIRNTDGINSFSPSNTADRTFIGNTAVYANYKATLEDGTQIAGRVIATCINKTLYTMHGSYPRGYTDTYVNKVFDKIRHSIKLK